MALIEIFGYILPDWMVYSFFGMIIIIGVIGFFFIKRRLSNPDDVQWFAWEYQPSGMIVKIFHLAPEEVTTSQFLIHEGDKERPVMHSHPWSIPGTNEMIFTIPFGSNKADNPEEMFHRNRDVRTPFPLVNAQADAIGRIQAKGNVGFSLRKNWFTLVVIFALGVMFGMVYLSYTKGVPIG